MARGERLVASLRSLANLDHLERATYNMGSDIMGFILWNQVEGLL